MKKQVPTIAVSFPVPYLPLYRRLVRDSHRKKMSLAAFVRLALESQEAARASGQSHPLKKQSA